MNALFAAPRTPHLSSSSPSFAGFGLQAQIVSNLVKKGIHTPTPIQEQAVPLLLKGKDLIGIAQTGTGKTLAFVLPIVHKLMQGSGQALILVPTRELATQVEQTIHDVVAHLTPRISACVLIGGASMYLQRQKLRQRPSIIVATPGRLSDHLKSKNLSLSKANIVVLDEADRMLDMGFARDVRAILQGTPKNRQTLLFSATMPSSIENLAKTYLTSPERIDVTPPGASISKIVQEVCFTPFDGKHPVLQSILDSHEGLILVFTRTKYGAAALLRKVKAMGHSAAEIHSNLSLGQRRQALEGFRSGKYRILIATDIAARGIDVDDVRLVINFDLPMTVEDYVHRIGRTGRAGREGKAITLAIMIESGDISRIERFTGVPMALSPQSLPRLAILTRSRSSRTHSPRRGRR